MMPLIHARYVKAALGGKIFPRELSDCAISVVQEGARKSDTIYNLTVKPQHMTENPAMGIKFINAVGDFVQQNLVKLSELLENAGRGGNSSIKEEMDRTIVKGLYAEGRRQHAIHDSASHWNIINIMPGSRRGYADLLSGKENIPENVVACKGLKVPHGFLGLPIEGCRGSIWFFVRKILPEKAIKSIFNLFDKNLENLYKGSKKAKSPHFLFSLDKPGTARDLYFQVRHGFSGFKSASRASIINTHDMFAGQKQALEQTIGQERANRVFLELTTWRPQNPEIVKNAHRIGEEALLSHIKPFIPNPRAYSILKNTSNIISGTVQAGRESINKLPRAFSSLTSGTAGSHA